MSVIPTPLASGSFGTATIQTCAGNTLCISSGCEDSPADVLTKATYQGVTNVRLCPVPGTWDMGIQPTYDVYVSSDGGKTWVRVLRNVSK